MCLICLGWCSVSLLHLGCRSIVDAVPRTSSRRDNKPLLERSIVGYFISTRILPSSVIDRRRQIRKNLRNSSSVSSLPGVLVSQVRVFSLSSSVLHPNVCQRPRVSIWFISTVFCSRFFSRRANRFCLILIAKKCPKRRSPMGDRTIPLRWWKRERTGWSNLLITRRIPTARGHLHNGSVVNVSILCSAIHAGERAFSLWWQKVPCLFIY